MRILLPAILFVTASVALLAIPYVNGKQQREKTVPLFPSGYANAIWEWRNPREADTSIFPSLKNDHIGQIFLDISTYVDIHEMSPGTEREDEIRQFEKAARVYIMQAKGAGLAVHALVGAPEWGLSSHEYLNEVLIDFVRTYNAANPEAAFAGIHFDLEVYQAEGFEANREAYLAEYLDTMSHIIDRVNATSTENDTANFALGVAIPSWFDGNHEKIGQVVWREEKKFVFNHLAKIINQYANSYFAVMAYRNTPDGPSGSIARAQDEIDFIAQNVPRLGVYVGLETKDIEPATSTFYGQEPKKLHESTLKIAKTFENLKSFKGIVIHDTEGYVDLNEK